MTDQSDFFLCSEVAKFITLKPQKKASKSSEEKSVRNKLIDKGSEMALYDELKRHKNVSNLNDSLAGEKHSGSTRFELILKDGSTHYIKTMKEGFEIARKKPQPDEPRQVVLNHPDALPGPSSTDDGRGKVGNPPPGMVTTGYSPKPGGKSGFNFTYGLNSEEKEHDDD
jgi:hypothetical protein